MPDNQHLLWLVLHLVRQAYLGPNTAFLFRHANSLLNISAEILATPAPGPAYRVRRLDELLAAPATSAALSYLGFESIFFMSPVFSTTSLPSSLKIR